MNDKFMRKLAQIRGSYTRKRFGTLNNEEKTLVDYETFCLELIKDYEKLQQENEQLKKELQKADSITQSCIFEGKEESELNFRKAINIIKELRNWLEEKVFNRGGSSIDISIELHAFCKVLDKLNELEGKNE